MNGVESYDVVIIGAGPAGYPAALRAAGEGASVAVVERDRPGGTCLNRGCIPTKYLVHKTANGAIDWPVLLDGMCEVVDSLVKGIEILWEKRGVDYYEGSGFIETPGAVRCEGANKITLRAEKGILWAPGSVTMDVPALPVDHELVLDSDDLLACGAEFNSCIVVGGGAIGLEWASIIARTGVAVTVVEMMPQLLPGLDEDVAKRLAGLMKRRGIKVLTGSPVANLETTVEGVTVTLDNGEELPADRALVAVGRTAAVDAGEAERLGVNLEKGRIVIDGAMATSATGIYAAGDAAGNGPMLAHLATKQGLAAAENILGKGPKIVDYDVIPWAVFSDPECAGVGLTAGQAVERGADVRESRMDYKALGRPRADGNIDGFVKIVAEEGAGRLLGAAALGHNASEIVQLVTAAMAAGGTVADLTEMIAIHPTYVEVVQEAADDWFGKAIHKL
ncbi:MAG: FAD-dependent oxidoreductase [Candidatus Coatesbacteria bacterium]|nr:MAG: FAD-dependent oxidoreductase [Candidatus Coatesbacteria bacterium]